MRSFPLGNSVAQLNIFQINTFHWHVVDAQSFPLVIPGFDELAAKGAYSASSIYTPSDVKEIVAYAAAVRLHVSRRLNSFSSQDSA